MATLFSATIHTDICDALDWHNQELAVVRHLHEESLVEESFVIRDVTLPVDVPVRSSFPQTFLRRDEYIQGLPSTFSRLHLSKTRRDFRSCGFT